MRGLARRGLEKSPRGQAHQVAIAGLVGGEQDETRPGEPLDALPRATVVVAEIDRQRAADDRLDADAGKLVGEFQRPEHVVGIGERQRRLAVGLGELGEPRNRHRPFEERIGRVHPQVHEADFCRHGVLANPLSGRDGGHHDGGCPSGFRHRAAACTGSADERAVSGPPPDPARQKNIKAPQSLAPRSRSFPGTARARRARRLLRQRRGSSSSSRFEHTGNDVLFMFFSQEGLTRP